MKIAENGQNDSVHYRDLCLTLPAPRPSSFHADAAEARSWLHGWVRSFGMVTSDAEWEAVDRQNNHVQAASFYPDCRSRKDALYCGAWLTWLARLDDCFDEDPLATDVHEARAFVDVFLRKTAAVRHGRLWTEVGGVSDHHFVEPLLGAFSNILAWATGSMSSPWRSRFLDHLDSWLRSYVDETAHRAQGVVLLPRELLTLKRVCMAVAPCCDLFERVSAGELAPRTRSMLDPLVDLACDITGALNDLVSLEKERACGDNHNLIESFMVHQNLAQNNAEAAVKNLIQQWAEQLRQQAATLPKEAAAGYQRQAALRWAGTCCTFVSGYHFWSLSTRRFELSWPLGPQPTPPPVPSDTPTG
jgi:terpene synthase-like protein